MITLHSRKVSDLVDAYLFHRQSGKTHAESEHAARVAGSECCDSAQIAEAIDLGAAIHWHQEKTGGAMPPADEELLRHWKKAGSPTG